MLSSTYKYPLGGKKTKIRYQWGYAIIKLLLRGVSPGGGNLTLLYGWQLAVGKLAFCWHILAYHFQFVLLHLTF